MRYHLVEWIISPFGWAFTHIAGAFTILAGGCANLYLWAHFKRCPGCKLSFGGQPLLQHGWTGYSDGR